MEQTVKRAHPVVPGHLAVAPRSSTAHPVRLGSPHELVLSLLPVQHARELAVGLARKWQSWSGARAAVVILGFVRSGRKLVGQSRDGEMPQVDESAFEPKQADAGLAQFALPESDILFRHEQSVSVVPFPSGTNTLGGVLLAAADRLELPDEECKEFAAWSGRLLDQASIVEEHLPGRCALEAAKIEALAEFAAGAGHEINNPLATIAGRAQLLLRDEVGVNRRQDLTNIGAQVLRVRDMIGDLMVFARPPAPAPQRLLLNDIAQSVIDRFAERARAWSCRLAMAAPGPVFATTDPTQASIVLSELIRNSLGAIGERAGGQIVIRLQRAPLAERPAALLSVTDNGPGLSEKDRLHLFDPFYSGREAGRGLGFGLCKCWRIVTGHGGRIEVDSVPDALTTFRVFWPDEPPRPAHDACALPPERI